jgi:hypothetical protein
VCGSGGLFRLPLGRSQADGFEDHRGDPVNSGLKAHGSPRSRTTSPQGTLAHQTRTARAPRHWRQSRPSRRRPAVAAASRPFAAEGLPGPAATLSTRYDDTPVPGGDVRKRGPGRTRAQSRHAVRSKCRRRNPCCSGLDVYEPTATHTRSPPEAVALRPSSKSARSTNEARPEWPGFVVSARCL